MEAHDAYTSSKSFQSRSHRAKITPRHLCIMILKLHPVFVINILQKWPHNTPICKMNEAHILEESGQVSYSSVLLSVILHIFNVEEAVSVRPGEAPHPGDKHHRVRCNVLIPTRIIPIHGGDVLATQIDHKVRRDVDVLLGSWCHRHDEVSYIAHQVSMHCIPSIHVSLKKNSNNDIEHISDLCPLSTEVPIHEKTNRYLQPHAKHHSRSEFCFSRCV